MCRGGGGQRDGCKGEKKMKINRYGGVVVREKERERSPICICKLQQTV